MRISIGLVVLLMGWALYSGCDAPLECQGSNVSYTRCISPTLVANCSGGGCHGGDQPLQNLQLEKVSEIYDNIFNRDVFVSGKSIKMVAPGDAANSYLYQKMLTNPAPIEGDRMPPFPRPLLSASQLEMFKIWINEGAKNDDPNYKSKNVTVTKPDIPADVKDVDFAADIRPVLQSKCGTAGCHDEGTKSGGVILSGMFYDGVVGKESLNKKYELIKVSKPAESLIYVKLLTERPQDAGTKMPPAGFTDLTTREKAMLWVWIEEGAKQ